MKWLVHIFFVCCSFLCKVVSKDSCEKDANSDILYDFDITCPSCCREASNDVWGTGTYTLESSICRAAIHDGVITDKGGLVSVYKAISVDSYVGSTNNGIATSDCTSEEDGFSFNGQSPSIICEGDISTIKCPQDHHINVTSANYGRTDKNTCPKENPNEMCSSDSTVLDKVRSTCDGKPNCTLIATNDAFYDPRSGVYKYLNVTYKCVNQGIASTLPVTSTTRSDYTTALTPTSRQPDTTVSETSQSTEPPSSQQPTTTSIRSESQTSGSTDVNEAGAFVTWLAIALASGAVLIAMCIVLAFWYFRRTKRQQQPAETGTANVYNERETVDNVLYSSYGNGMNTSTASAYHFASDGNERETVDNPVYADWGNQSEKEEVDNILYGVSKADDQKIEVDNILYGVSNADDHKLEVDNVLYAVSKEDDQKIEVDNVLYAVSKEDDQKKEVDNVLYGSWTA